MLKSNIRGEESDMEQGRKKTRRDMSEREAEVEIFCCAGDVERNKERGREARKRRIVYVIYVQSSADERCPYHGGKYQHVLPERRGIVDEEDFQLGVDVQRQKDTDGEGRRSVTTRKGLQSDVVTA